ncbi:MAG: hypothetical protein ACTSWW_01800 [Promethearchaeota archaeon]
MNVGEEDHIFQIAIKYVEEGDQYAEAGDYVQAIDILRKAAELFEQSQLSPVEKQNIMKMIQLRTRDFKEKVKEQGSTFTEGSASEGRRTPQLSPQESQRLVDAGMAFLKQAEQSLNQSNYVEALGEFQEALKFLTKAGWTTDKLAYIYAIVVKIGKLVESQPTPTSPQRVRPQQQKKGGSTNYIPTFLQTSQGDVLANQAPLRSTTKSGAARDTTYVPTFSQTTQSDVITAEGQKRPKKPPQAGSSKKYVPTFAQTGQKDIVPDTHVRSSPSIGEAPAFNLSEIHSLIKKTTSDTEGSADLHGSLGALPSQDLQSTSDRPLQTPLSPQKSSQEIPTFQLADLQTQIEHRTQLLLDNYHAWMDLQQERDKQAMQVITKIHNLEVALQYNLAVAQIEEIIETWKTFPGWGQKISIFYAWQLVLREKLHLAIRPKDQMNDVHRESLEREFQKLIPTSLRSPEGKSIDFEMFVYHPSIVEDLFTRFHKDHEYQLDQAFEMVDRGNLIVLNKKYAQAMEIYTQARVLLQTLHFHEEPPSIDEIITDLYEMQNLVDQSLSQTAPVASSVSDSLQMASPLAVKEALQAQDLQTSQSRQSDERRIRLEHLKKQKQVQEDAQEIAFKWIREAEQLVQSHLYDDALQKYQDAVKKLMEAGWEQQLRNILHRIDEIALLRDQHITQSQQDFLTNLQQMESTRFFRDQMRERAKDQEDIYLQIEKWLEKITQNVQTLDFKTAYTNIEKTRVYMKKIGWLEGPISFLDQWEAKINLQEASQIEQIQLEERKQKEQAQMQTDFETFLQEQSDLIQKNREKKLAQLEKIQQQKAQNKNLEQNAFQLMEKAEHAIDDNHFQEARTHYEEANAILSSLGWTIDNATFRAKVDKSEDAYLNQLDREKTASQQKEEIARQKSLAVITLENKKQQALSDIKAMLHGEPDDSEETTAHDPAVSPSDTKEPRSMSDEIRLLLGKTDEDPAISTQEDDQREDAGAQPEVDELKRMIKDAAKKKEANGS